MVRGCCHTPSLSVCLSLGLSPLGITAAAPLPSRRLPPRPGLSGLRGAGAQERGRWARGGGGRQQGGGGRVVGVPPTPLSSQFPQELFIANSQKYAQETELSQHVRRWEERMGPLLQEQAGTSPGQGDRAGRGTGGQGSGVGKDLHRQRPSCMRVWGGQGSPWDRMMRWAGTPVGRGTGTPVDKGLGGAKDPYGQGSRAGWAPPPGRELGGAGTPAAGAGGSGTHGDSAAPCPDPPARRRTEPPSTSTATGICWRGAAEGWASGAPLPAWWPGSPRSRCAATCWPPSSW